MAKVDALCVSDNKGEQKHPVAAAVFRAGYGIEGDAHAGDWHRQVSLLSAADIETVRRQGLPDLAAGAFAENMIISGLDLAAMGLGTRLRLGDEVILSVTQIGKVCHAPCRIQELTGDCIMPRSGLFTRVEASGKVRAGDDVEMIEIVPREVFPVVLLTISDRCSAGEAEDTAGPAVCGMVDERMDARVYRREIIPDERSLISERLKHYCDGHSIDLILTVGGTGFSPRDVTPEATREVVERLCPGLDEAMRAASLVKTRYAMLSRGVSGIRNSTLVVNLPGSERAAIENLEVVLPSLAHGLTKLRGDQSDCGHPSA